MSANKQWLFPGALLDSRTYRRAQRWWLTLVEGLQLHYSLSDWTFPYPHEVLTEGNPILITESAQDGRSLRVLHFEPGDPDDLDIVTWTEIRRSPMTDQNMQELVLGCCPSQENKGRVETILVGWMCDGKEPDDGGG